MLSTSIQFACPGAIKTRLHSSGLVLKSKVLSSTVFHSILTNNIHMPALGKEVFCVITESAHRERSGKGIHRKTGLLLIKPYIQDIRLLTHSHLPQENYQFSKL